MGITRFGLNDNASGADVGLDWSQHQIHKGKHFTITDYATVGDGGVREFLITTADSDAVPHFNFEVSGTLDTRVELYEDSAKTAQAANLLTPINNNRRSSTTSETTIHLNPLGDDALNGTLIYTDKFGSDTAIGSPRRTSRDEGEFLLKGGTKYLLKVVSLTAANVLSTYISWYENTPVYS